MKTLADLGIRVNVSSGETDTQCPWCSSERKKKHAKCLSVNVDKGTYLCHHCGAAGGVGMEHRTPSELHWQKPAYRKPAPIQQPANEDVDMLRWFQKRGIPGDVVKRNGISPQSVWMPQVEDKVRAYCFPYYRNGELVNAKYRDAQKNFCMVAGAERVLYGLDDVDKNRVVIVEGEIDKLSVEAAGIKSCVSVPDGAPSPASKNYASKFRFLDDSELIEGVKQWVIAVDNDEPGVRLEQELVRRFGAERCRIVAWPAGCKDANDVLIKHGPAALKDCIDRAPEYPIKGVVEISQISSYIDALYEEGERPGLSTGWRNLDEHYTVRPGELTVITGIPNSGKSNFLDAMLVNIARDHSWAFAIFSPENQPLQNHTMRLMEKYAGQPFRPGPTPRMTPETKDHAREWADYHFSYILSPDEDDWSLDEILKATAALVRRKGIRGLVIDPWNELEHQRPDGMSETEFVSACLKKVRQFARKHQIHIWIVAHPAKMYRDKDGKYPVPTLYDVSGSAHFRNKADNGLVVWRNLTEPNDPVEVHVQKIRFREVGKLGVVKFKYDPVVADYLPFGGLRPVDRWGPV